MAIAMIGLDTAKNLFQVHGLDEGGSAGYSGVRAG